MKLKLNLELDIELTEGGKKVHVSNLWKAAQEVTASNVVEEPVGPQTKDSLPPSGGDESKNHAKDISDSASDTAAKQTEKPEPQVAPPILNPLGALLCELLERVADASQTVKSQAFEDLKDRTVK